MLQAFIFIAPSILVAIIKQERDTLKLLIPNTEVYLHEGDLVKLRRFDDQIWELKHGWYSFGGNRPFCGWYLCTNMNNEYTEKPLQLTDLNDIYVVTRTNKKGGC